MLGSFATSWYFFKLLEKFHGPLAWRMSLNMYYFSQIAKYIPGKIWSMLFQGLIGQGRISTTSIVLANVELTATQINNTLFTGLALILFLNHQFIALVLVLIIGAALCYTLSVSCLINKLSARLINLLRKTKRFQHWKMNTDGCHPQFRKIDLIVFFLVFCACAAISHVVLLLSIFSFDTQTAIFYAALLILSWIIGVVVMISPAGMGIRELIFIVLAQLSSQQIDQQTLAAIAVVTRLWMIAYELLGVALLYLFNKRFPQRQTSSPSI